ncbi:MAG: DNA binding protein [Natronospirillum sp.]|uniref:DNA binding protein n=1 Tax=Natronospirillum sp. TaxID=2812955 RepID=UPI0025D0FA5E|nr:DNA binding protein [Natronospirillum sp.]MCH8552954.1 DNA binding protein [Natronospirillum sp.]
MFVQEIDRKIEEFKSEIEKLEAERAAQAKKLEGFSAFENDIQKVCRDFGVSREELFVSQGDYLVEWVKSLNKLSERPEVYNELKAYFARVIAREGSTRKSPAKKASSGPKLEVGSYKNPKTGETIEKIKRNPKTLDEWISEHGIETVRSWKV